MIWAMIRVGHWALGGALGSCLSGREMSGELGSHSESRLLRLRQV
jgi:hypothetical protein